MRKRFWDERWCRNEIGFHKPDVHPYLKSYLHRLNAQTGETIFVPLCGKSLDLLWLRDQGLEVVAVEWNRLAVEAFFRENSLDADVVNHGGAEIWRTPGVSIYLGDFFALDKKILSGARLVYDRAALVALPPDMRRKYAVHLSELLPGGSRLLLVANHYDMVEEDGGPPFSVPPTEVIELFGDDFSIDRLCSEETIRNHPGLRSRGLTAFHDAVYLLVRR
ncbi:MAG: thiopurine S-methyltransferase [Desulfuromonas sp.]|nr:MAG: thiopurine S-methyltransferase [Desulfuromonas sp.]